MDEIRIREIEGRVMASIREGRLIMRPKWEFKFLRAAKISAALAAAAGFAFFAGSFVFAYMAHHNAGYAHANRIVHWACDNVVLLGISLLALLLAGAAYRLSRGYENNTLVMAAFAVILIVGIGGNTVLHQAVSAWSAERNVKPLMAFYNDVLGVDHEHACKANIS